MGSGRSKMFYTRFQKSFQTFYELEGDCFKINKGTTWTEAPRLLDEVCELFCDHNLTHHLCIRMPPKIAKVTSKITTAQRASQHATRVKSRATSLKGSCIEIEPEVRDTI